MSTEVLAQAFASTASVLSNVSASQLDDPTPCNSWKVRDLVNHVVGGTTYFAESVETGVSPSITGSHDFTAGDVLTTFEEGSARALAAFGAEGAMDKIIRAPIGDVPGSIFVWIASVDSFAHGWDLAKATGQSTDLDPALAEQLLAVSKQAVSDDLRGVDKEKPFGPEVEVAESANPADRLAAFLGRRP